MPAKSILTRKVDLVYLIFFMVHLVVMFNVDLYPLYPEWLRPKYMTDLRHWYVATYADQFFVSPPAWFNTYIWLEFLYHVPLCVWSIPALLKADPRVPVQLLVYSVFTGVTTLTCIADFFAWTTVASQTKTQLAGLYVPYLAVSVFMGLDMVARLNAKLAGSTPPPTVGTKKTR
ncbi:hypothetical protein K461DRAFT_278118 [Myriangium duriaei CBS 260.36]|uniref:Efficient mitochondria targeting-associated protein 19 n=1 Tax=Myriangium duriaei CBS 260.36 TaxID=1168546 RepID=A0A9P4J2I6_9PEZI|nr:hypothetical protein K461DRAFT_278118 [Myriangium duriaei CBS 260.36]